MVRLWASTERCRSSEWVDASPSPTGVGNRARTVQTADFDIAPPGLFGERAQPVGTEVLIGLETSEAQVAMLLQEAFRAGPGPFQEVDKPIGSVTTVTVAV